ncbi:hypothetical protein FIBSPDRAFT_836380 [Athelia psychrophila]|uniref:Uncharacterized protein n=1 Tax=Athelia psychrophila TaxID=1759441 RepID=A0A166B6M7_9AGAM|nr:hypothetical protein FIBSPDRAFT_836380 [Fibularhizoctonia sp. CBS 109695]
MLQYLLLLCAFAVPGICALAVPVIEATAEDPKCLDITHCRTLWNIVWTCFVTVFACIWVSIHRNVVLDSESAVDAFLDRLRIAALTILVPEYTLAWAVRQWIVARQLSEEFSEISRKFQAVFPPDARVDSSWTVTHGFFVLMGGFYYTDGHPVSREDLEVIIRTRPFEPPDDLDIKGRSKSDAFSKTVTILQTAWFAIQCTARAIQYLPITNLEIATLAYAAMTVQMNLFWINKPLNVSLPIRLEQVPGPEFQRIETLSTTEEVEEGWRARIEPFIKAMVGTQDDEVHLSELSQVPTLYSGKPEEHQAHLANAIAMAVGMIFGAVHCFAWSFAFPSQAEKLLWRISAVTTVVIPLFYCVLVVLIAMEVNLGKPVMILSAVAIPFYLMARAVLLVLTFTTLRNLPPAAYEAIHWMTFIPHV